LDVAGEHGDRTEFLPIGQRLGAPGTAPSPGPIKVPDDQLRKLLGIANVTFKQNELRIAIIVSPL